MTEPEIAVSGDPDIETVRKKRDAWEIKEPGQRSAEREVTEDFSGSFHAMEVFPCLSHKIHRLEVICAGKMWKKRPGLALLKMEIANRMMPVPPNKKIFCRFTQGAVGIVDQCGSYGLGFDGLRLHG
jgi:hypothetical protein